MCVRSFFCDIGEADDPRRSTFSSSEDLLTPTHPVSASTLLSSQCVTRRLYPTERESKEEREREPPSRQKERDQLRRGVGTAGMGARTESMQGKGTRGKLVRIKGDAGGRERALLGH